MGDKARLTAQACACLSSVVLVSGCDALHRLTKPAESRCPPGFVATAARCCAEGQRLDGGHCTGRPMSCPEGWSRVEAPVPGCTRELPPVRVPEGRFLVGPNDWESEQVLASGGVVGEFWLDATEVTVAKWVRCVSRAMCPDSPLGVFAKAEPGLPVVTVSAEQARQYCAAVGGRLPRAKEWLRVATGDSSRRFPWGQTGLVCRRASFGLVRGPCAENGSTPDLAGARPDGRSELDLYDLVGNVAELVETEAKDLEIRGGSYRSDHPSALKSWASVPYAGAAVDVGFRCAYDRAP